MLLQISYFDGVAQSDGRLCYSENYHIFTEFNINAPDITKCSLKVISYWKL